MELPILATARLVLRPFAAADAGEIVRLAGAREVAATTLRIPHPYSEADAMHFLSLCRALAESGSAFIFAITRDGCLCGSCGLEVDHGHQRAELGYWIGVPYWGCGYATEAAAAVVAFGFTTLGLHRICALHFVENPASGRVLAKIGMRREGCLRGHVLKWGQFHDLEAYAILREEFVSGGGSNQR